MQVKGNHHRGLLPHPQQVQQQIPQQILGSSSETACMKELCPQMSMMVIFQATRSSCSFRWKQMTPLTLQHLYLGLRSKSQKMRDPVLSHLLVLPAHSHLQVTVLHIIACSVDYVLQALDATFSSRSACALGECQMYMLLFRVCQQKLVQVVPTSHTAS